MRDFIEKSKTFNSFVFNGCYDMDRDVFFRAYEYYQNTGKNILDDFSNMIYLDWDYKECVDSNDYFYEYDKLLKYENSQSRLRHSRIFKTDWLAEKRDKLRHLKNRYNKYREIQINKPRIEASCHTSNKLIREKVFNIYGKKCLKCGSEINLQIDHVIPVAMGGNNDINNYQPLCKTCNIRKGTKIIDYRQKHKL